MLYEIIKSICHKSYLLTNTKINMAYNTVLVYYIYRMYKVIYILLSVPPLYLNSFTGL